MELKEFLHAKSMVTPGVAGLIAMLITNALHTQFSIPAAWAALVISFMIGALTLADTTTKLPVRLLLYLINSLVIFSIAVGTNTAGTATTQAPEGMFPVDGQRPFFAEWFE
jgi:hypothetical protein